jgi:hypothetical protein
MLSSCRRGSAASAVMPASVIFAQFQNDSFSSDGMRLRISRVRSVICVAPA